MDERIAKHLYDALQAAKSVAEFVEGINFDRYSEHLLLRSAVERQLEILGEALRRIRDSDEAIMEGIAGGHQAISFRNILAHGYDQIDNRIVWSIIETHLPKMISDIDGLLNE